MPVLHYGQTAQYTTTEPGAKASMVFPDLSPYLTDPRIDYYELAELQGAPSLIRGTIVHGMRRDVPEDQHSHFAPITWGEDEWKKAVSYSAAKDTYLVLAEPSGHIVWQTSGVPDDEKVTALKQALAKLLPAPQP